MDTIVVIGHLDALDDALADHLRDEGLAVVETADGREGLRLVYSQNPVLTFVEVDSPNHENFHLLPELRRAMDEEGRIIAVCNRYSEPLDDYCERMGANMALPQVRGDANFGLFVRGLITLIPGPSGDERNWYAEV